MTTERQLRFQIENFEKTTASLQQKIIELETAHTEVRQENATLKEHMTQMQQQMSSTLESEIRALSDIFLYGHHQTIEKLMDKVSKLETALLAIQTRDT